MIMPGREWSNSLDKPLVAISDVFGATTLEDVGYISLPTATGYFSLFLFFCTCYSLPTLHRRQCMRTASLILRNFINKSVMMIANPGRDLVTRVTIACGVLETVAVCLRLLARCMGNSSLAADDWWIVATLVPSYAMLANGMISVFPSRPLHMA